MRWLAKAALQKALSAAPGGQHLNYLLQRHVTHGLPRPPAELMDKFRAALRHWRAARDHGGGPPRSAFEFGPGWELAVALCLFMLGVERQVLADLRPLLRPGLLAHAAGFYRQRRPELERLAGRELRPLPPGPVGLGWLRALGIDYRAPLDAARSGLPAGSMDLIHSTQVLEHVPAAALAPLLRECRRLAAPAGVVSLTIDMADHYLHFDPGISPYNFLRYSDAAWGLINSGLHYQNRLRLFDYLQAAQEAGLAVAARELTMPDRRQRAALAALPLAARFAGRDPQDLMVLEAHLVCVPA